MNTFLSWRAFAPLARLSFVMYLVHDLVVNGLAPWYTFSISFMQFNVVGLKVLRVKWGTRNNVFLQAMHTMATFSVTVAVSIPLVVLLEMPLAHMEKLSMGTVTRKK